MTAPILSPSICFEVWDFSTARGGGHAVLRTAWCVVAARTTVVRQATHLGPEWIGTRETMSAWSAGYAIERYRARWSVPVVVTGCRCGCLAGTDRDCPAEDDE